MILFPFFTPCELDRTHHRALEARFGTRYNRVELRPVPMWIQSKHCGRPHVEYTVVDVPKVCAMFQIADLFRPQFTFHEVYLGG